MSHKPIAASERWRDRQPLTGTDLIDFLALRRVCGRADSRIGKVGDDYVENGHPLLLFLADSLTTLIEVGHVTLGEPDTASCGIRPITVTTSGRARYEELCDRQKIPPYPTE